MGKSNVLDVQDIVNGPKPLDEVVVAKLQNEKPGDFVDSNVVKALQDLGYSVEKVRRLTGFSYDKLYRLLKIKDTAESLEYRNALRKRILYDDSPLINHTIYRKLLKEMPKAKFGDLVKLYAITSELILNNPQRSSDNLNVLINQFYQKNSNS